MGLRPPPKATAYRLYPAASSRPCELRCLAWSAAFRAAACRPKRPLILANTPTPFAFTLPLLLLLQSSKTGVTGATPGGGVDAGFDSQLTAAAFPCGCSSPRRRGEEGNRLGILRESSIEDSSILVEAMPEALSCLPSSAHERLHSPACSWQVQDTWSGAE